MPALAEAVLAMMITLAPPGQSALSVVVEPSCGVEPGKPACDLRPRPSFSPFYKAFVRLETKDEALDRYATIARAIEATSVAMTTQKARSDGSIEAAPWPGTPLDLAQALVTIAHHESSFRLDVHSGVGPYALGDCAYWDHTGKRVPASEARKRGVVGTSCQSVCLMQLNTGGLKGSRFGSLGSEMVGVGPASTERCFAAGARALTEARARCAEKSASEKNGSGSEKSGWFARTAASYVTGDACDTENEWVSARVATLERITKISAGSLPKEARARLQGPAAKASEAQAE